MLAGRIHTHITSRARARVRYIHAHPCAFSLLFNARPFIRRKTLWCISFDAVCALVMQIPCRPALATWIFRDTDASSAFSAFSRGMEIPHRQGRVNFDMYVRNRRANYTAAMHNAWEPNGNRLHHDERQTESEKERRKSAKAVVDVLPSCLPRPSSDSPRFTIRCLRAKRSTLSSCLLLL